MTEPLADAVTLVCDGCVRSRVHLRQRGTMAELKAAVTAKAIEAGWTVDGKTAFCPACAKGKLH
jgi:hypothetical protein